MELRLPLEMSPGREAACRAVFGTWVFSERCTERLPLRVENEKSFLVTHLSFGPCQNMSDGELMIVLLIIFLTDVSLFKNMLRPILNVRANIF